MKCNCNDFGTGVFFMLRYPERCQGGRVSDALSSQIDVYPTLCEWLDIPIPDHVQGTSLLPVIADEQAEVNKAIFSEVTYHAAAEPMRAIRTHKHLFIKRWGPRLKANGSNSDVCYSKRYLVERGLPEREYDEEELYDNFDPQQRHNLINDPQFADIAQALRDDLAAWMERTDDPLCKGVDNLPDGGVCSTPMNGTPTTAAARHQCCQSTSSA